MLTKRVIPCLDVKDGRTVKGTNFLNLRDAGDPVELAARYSDEGADELVLLDISASLEGRKTFLHVVETVARRIQIPFSVGGGISTVEDIRRVLNSGADKVCLNSAILGRPDLLQEGCAHVGSQSIVAALDVKKTNGRWSVFSKSGTQPTGRDAIQWAQEVVQRGAGELLVTSMDRDGTTAGYDIGLLQRIAESVTVPVIASGGAGTKEHMKDAICHGRADAVLAATVFHFGRITIHELKQFLSMYDIPVRM